MRFYAVGNQYLSSIQQGIQAFHALGDMVSHYGAEEAMVDDWLRNHKTLVCLNGGNNARLNAFYDFVNDDQNPYPFSAFSEDEDSLGGMLTCVGIIVPDKIYKISMDDANTWDGLTPWEIDLAFRLKKMPTAK
jgi:hypothetical protein